MADAVSLTSPNERRFFAVPRLLVGGIAVRLNLPYEQLDDLQLAVESVLARSSAFAEELTLRLSLSDGGVVLELGPLANGNLLDERRPDAGGGLGLRRLLGTLVDDVAVSDGDGGSWLRLAKSVTPIAQG